jgi:hypothetical protein
MQSLWGVLARHWSQDKCEVLDTTYATHSTTDCRATALIEKLESSCYTM